MKNRKRHIIFIFVLLLQFAFWGCIGEDSPPSYPGEKVPVRITLLPFAVNTDPNASEKELIVKSAYVFIYNASGVLENPDEMAVTTPVTPGGEVIDADKRLNRTWEVIVGNKDIYVVVNPDPELTARLVSTLTRTELVNLLTARSGFNVGDFETQGMLMTGHAFVAVDIGNSSVQMTVKRRHARIDLLLRKVEELTEDAVLRSVTLVAQEQVGLVFEAGTGTYADYSAKADQTITLVGGVTIAPVFNGVITDFYTYPRPAAPDNLTSLALEMVIAVNGIERTITAYLNTAALEGNTGNNPDLPLAIDANMIYQVGVTLSRQSEDIVLDILDWSDAETDTPIYGTTLRVSRSVVVMDFNILGGRTAVVTYDSSNNQPVSVVVTVPQSWLSVTSDSGSVTLTHVGTSTIPGADAVITLTSGNVSRTITAKWSTPPIP